MTTNIINQVSYLPTTRLFPQDPDLLLMELTKSYIDIAGAVNSRIIAIFPTIQSAITGENWFLTNNQRQQGFRKVFSFTSTASIDHGLTFASISRFTRCYGEFTDGTNWYGLISGSNVAIPGQISFYITPTQIVFLVGAGAPALTLGNLVLEWISLP